MRWFAPVLLSPVLSVSPAAATPIATVEVGDPGNPSDTRFLSKYSGTVLQGGVGAVPGVYYIGRTEVTNAQYVDFLNAVAASDPYDLFQSHMADETLGGIVRMGSDGSYTYSVKAPNGSYTYGDKPVNYITCFDAMRFANWLHNGAGSGDTETGAYTLLGGTPTPSNSEDVGRNPGASWFLPNLHEWYKAAFYDEVTQTYFDYPTRSDVAPDNAVPADDSGNSTNHSFATGSPSMPFTTVGAYVQSPGPWGTFDQGGNVREWTESKRRLSFASRTLTGGSYSVGPNYQKTSDFWWEAQGPHAYSPDYGFRVATLDGTFVVMDGTTQAELDALESTEWDVRVEGSEVRTELSMPNLVEILGSLSIIGNTVLETVALASLEYVGGDVDLTGNITENDSAGGIDLSGLAEVGGDVNITENDSAGGIDLSGLETAGGDVTVTENPNAGTVDFGNLETAEGDVTVTENPNAGTVDFGNLETVGGDVTVESNGAADTVDLGGVSVGGALRLGVEAQTVIVQRAQGTTSVTLHGSESAPGVAEVDLPADPSADPGILTLTWITPPEPFLGALADDTEVLFEPLVALELTAEAAVELDTTFRLGIVTDDDVVLLHEAVEVTDAVQDSGDGLVSFVSPVRDGIWILAGVAHPDPTEPAPESPRRGCSTGGAPAGGLLAMWTIASLLRRRRPRP